MSRTAIVWYRRDLRLHDHPALTTATREYERVVPVFVLDDRLLRGRFASGARTAFMLGCLRVLDGGLRERGAALCVRHGGPAGALLDLARATGAEAVLWTSDVAPYARARDARVSAALREGGVQARPHGGAYTADVSTLRRPDGAPFTVFSPFDRALRAASRRAILDAPGAVTLPEGVETGRVPALAELGLRDELVAAAREAGEAAARRAMEAWLDGPIEGYGRRHDLSDAATSVLSPYLRWGCLSALELEARAAALGTRAARSYVRQLHWRDFYAHVLLTHPDSAHHELQPRLRELEYAQDEERLAAWRAGRTGFPLVDAGMRQLAATGWMHNRARLTAGSFLTKDLHLDWRAGEAWFERLLLDGEPAQNNGNWQWIASTGVDPQPVYKRVLNPVLQQRRFDPSGAFVRRWVPELQRVPAERLAEPWTMSRAEQRAAGCAIGEDYPAPIVDHAAERRRALERYAAAAALTGGRAGPGTPAPRP
jgi:deoxyribodipyrimidine photo-lyase